MLALHVGTGPSSGAGQTTTLCPCSASAWPPRACQQGVHLLHGQRGPRNAPGHPGRPPAPMGQSVLACCLLCLPFAPPADRSLCVGTEWTHLPPRRPPEMASGPGPQCLEKRRRLPGPCHQPPSSLKEQRHNLFESWVQGQRGVCLPLGQINTEPGALPTVLDHKAALPHLVRPPVTHSANVCLRSCLLEGSAGFQSACTRQQAASAAQLWATWGMPREGQAESYRLGHEGPWRRQRAQP